MKPNVAPEKIYIEITPDGTRYYRDVVKEQRTENSDIEYTRADAFIEKAAEWQRKELCNYFDAPIEDFERFIEDFKNYMKGE